MIKFNTLFTIYMMVTFVHTSNSQIYVDVDATSGNNDGSSWSDAFITLQPALDLAVATGDDVWVAEGTYLPTEVPNTSFSGNDRLFAFHFASTDIKIYGGFNGTESNLSQRDWINNITVLSGDFNGDDVITGSGSTLNITNNNENAYVVFVTANTTNNTVVDGFNITGGYANSAVYYSYDGLTFYGANGGGILNLNSSAIYNNMTINACSSIAGGGGMYNSSSSIELNNTTFSNNLSSFGGGINNTNSPITISNSKFIGNRVTESNSKGAGIYNVNSSISVSNSVFASNAGTAFNSKGGGMFNDGASNAILNNVVFNSNSSIGMGGGLYNENSSPEITNVVFYNNTTNNYGGGIGNKNSSPTLTNVTFSNNNATFGGGISNETSSPTLLNTLFYGNSANDIYLLSSTVNTTYSAFENYNYNGATGCITLTSNPFNNDVDPDGADNIWMTTDDGLALATGSVCLAAGTAAGGAPTTDITGATRPGTPSIGAYDSNTTVNINELNAKLDVTIYPNPNNGRFTIKLNNQLNDSYTSKIYNQLGKLVFKTELNNNINEINMDHLDKGIYTIHIENESEKIVYQVVIN